MTVVKPAVSKVRSRLTWKALQAIQQRCCAPLTSREHPHAFFAGYRLAVMDGSNFEVMADRGFVGYSHWQAGVKTGAQLLWRMPKNLILPVEKQLDDGSYLSSLYPSERDRKQKTNGIAVRVIEYTLPNVPDSEPMYRLLTTLLDDRAHH